MRTTSFRMELKIVPYYDRSDIVNASVNTVNKALIEGAILVLIVLYLLLRSFRGSFVVLIALPLSLLVTFIVMKIVGLSANLMSLGGLAISIGMIIDCNNNSSGKCAKTFKRKRKMNIQNY